MNGNKLRNKFLEFFREKNHLIMPSAPLVPENDPTLLWINAGMAPFKPYFSGKVTPPSSRIATSQKCIRTNDIKNVGKTARHHTFFEMLGNFSFGDYFKEKAIIWSWEFVTEVLNLEEDRLWVTIYKDDDEAFNIWKNIVGVKEEKIVRMGKDENFWQHGTGPCGPCSELHYDRGEEYGNSSEDIIGGEGDRFLEIWNLVFTQYEYTDEGEYIQLPRKNIDTGMGLERVASILQGVDSNFETDLIKPIIEDLESKSSYEYKHDEEITMAYRLIADHIRGITMAISDGVLPENEGRGYIIRRLLRRAVRYGGKLGFNTPFLYKMVPVVNQIMGESYPKLYDNEEHIQKVVQSEEKRFFETLEQGLNILENMIAELKVNKKNILSGDKAFKLYDTYGFPLDLTREILEENDLEVDEDEFSKKMQEQKSRAREAREDFGFSGSKAEKIYRDIKDEIESTDFLGYRNLDIQTDIKAIIKDGERVDSLKEEETGEIILKRTPFYAESGGQVGDLGIIEDNCNLGQVVDTYDKAELIVHKVKVERGTFKQNQFVKAKVFAGRRKAAARNHSCTHLLHKALKEVLGEHVYQSGSLVSPERLRFDFSHFSSLTEEEIKKVEYKVNKSIINNYPVETMETTLEKAKDMGAVALFGDAYGQQVRVVKIGNYSIELCGGTHVSFTGEIGLFKIINESGVASGTRRIEAITGYKALDYINEKEQIIGDIAEKLSTDQENILQRLSNLLDEKKELEREIRSLKDRLSNYKLQELKNEIKKVNDINLLTAKFENMDNEGLRKIADKLKSNLDSAVIVLGSTVGDKVIFVSVVTEDLIEEGYHAGDLIGKVAEITGGGGGGRPDMAQAGGSKIEKLDEALNEVENFIK
ncbi:MAG: alanine--tRNA ligase [Halanaerobiaceae bacterium]